MNSESQPPNIDVVPTLNLFPEVTWDRWAGDGIEHIGIFGWIPREDGKSDFIYLMFDADGLAFFTTSSALYSADFGARLGSINHNPCKRVEDFWPGVNCVRKAPEETIVDSSEPIHEWFNLSYASYLVVPRSILQSCSIPNQQALVKALDAIYDECSANMENHWPHEADIQVKLKSVVTGKLIKDDLADYDRGRRRLW